MKDKIKYILIVLFISLGIIFWRYLDNASYRACLGLENDILELNLHGVVINKFEDRNNHGYETVIVLQDMDRIKFYLIADTSKLFDSIQIGDSIYKKLNSMDVVLVKDSLKKEFIIECNCEARKVR